MEIFSGYNCGDFKLFIRLYGKEKAIKMIQEYAKELLRCRL